MPDQRFGATPEEWEHFAETLALTEDLLPVVSDPSAQISENSTLSVLGKVPSLYNGAGKAVGIKDWTSKKSTPAETALWASGDYGISLQTRNVRAIDCDIVDEALAEKVWKFLEDWGLPARCRAGSPKFLLAFRVGGDLGKRILRCGDKGIIEFLGSGQQFIAAGTHPSGARYEWAGGLPLEIPALGLGEFEALWKGLSEAFGEKQNDESRMGTGLRRSSASQEILPGDPVLSHLEKTGQVLSLGAEGQANIICPFVSAHTAAGSETATTYFPAGSRGYERGHFVCLHAHCAGRSEAEFLEGVGYGEWFSDLGPAAPPESPPRERFTAIPVADYAARKAPGWIIKNVLPRADLAVLFGDSTVGKTFVALDMDFAIARGTPWNEHKTEQGRVVYICAEGAGSFSKRLRAYAQHHGISLESLPFQIIADAPSFLDKNDIAQVTKKIMEGGPVATITIDTMAQAIAGGDENAGEVIGRVISHCKVLTRQTGAIVKLVHHTGKDLTKGARGWSGLRAAADCEIEISRIDSKRFLRISKQKDGEDGREWGLNLVNINIDIDEDGDAVTSCVVEYLDGVKRKTKQKQRGEKELAILKAFDDLGGVKASIDDLITKALEYIPYDPQQRDQRRAKLRRAIGSLGADGVFVVFQDTVENII